MSWTTGCSLHQRPRHHPRSGRQAGRRQRLHHVLRARTHPHPDQAAGRPPTTGDESLPDDRYMRTLDPWVSLGTACASPRCVDGGGATGRARPHHTGEIDRDARSPVRRPGQRRRRIRLEHRRTRRPQRAARAAAHHAARVPGGDARVVDAGGGVIRRRVRELRPELGVAQAHPVTHPDPRRRGGDREELQWIARSADGWITTPRDFDIDEPVKLLQDTWAAAATGRHRSSRWTSSRTPKSWRGGPTSA